MASMSRRVSGGSSWQKKVAPGPSRAKEPDNLGMRTRPLCGGMRPSVTLPGRLQGVPGPDRSGLGNGETETGACGGAPPGAAGAQGGAAGREGPEASRACSDVGAVNDRYEVLQKVRNSGTRGEVEDWPQRRARCASSPLTRRNEEKETQREEGAGGTPGPRPWAPESGSQSLMV